MTRRPIADHAAAVAAHLADLARHSSESAESIAVRDALGRVTASPVSAPFSLPLFDNSAMDGFAVRAAEVTAGTTLPVSGRIFAGDSAPEQLPPGAAMAIMTGAPLPVGADAVIQAEVTHEADGHVRFDQATTPGAFVRPAGDDVHAGDRLIEAGTQLAPRHLGGLAASGVATVEVFRRPKVAVISTGSELIGPGTQPSGGQVFESNSLVLSGLVTENGGEVTSVATARDDGSGRSGDFADVLTRACADADLVLTSGGISMGEREPVRHTLGEHGWFGAVAMQPGGPQGLATWDETPVCCFPGNPVSVLVSFEVFLRHLLRELAGLPAIEPVPARLTVDVTSMAGKTQFRRGLLSPDGVTPVGGPGSHLAAAAAAADVLIEIEDDVTELAAGTKVLTWPMT